MESTATCSNQYRVMKRAYLAKRPSAERGERWADGVVPLLAERVPPAEASLVAGAESPLGAPSPTCLKLLDLRAVCRQHRQWTSKEPLTMNLSSTGQLETRQVSFRLYRRPQQPGHSMLDPRTLVQKRGTAIREPRHSPRDRTEPRSLRRCQKK